MNRVFISCELLYDFILLKYRFIYKSFYLSRRNLQAKKKSPVDSQTCMICHQDEFEPWVTSCCGKRVHRYCLQRWIDTNSKKRRNCPACRRSMLEVSVTSLKCFLTFPTRCKLIGPPFNFVLDLFVKRVGQELF